MMFRRKETDRKGFDISRTTQMQQQFEPAPSLILGRVTGATPIAGNPYRWEYTCVEAWMSGATATVRPNGITMTAYSVSELSNPAALVPGTWFSYGVTGANLPGGWVPVQIPILTFVILSAHRRADGSLVWLIINTQAIDGTCIPGGS